MLEKIARMAEAYDIAIATHCPNGPISLAASLQDADWRHPDGRIAEW